MRWDSPAMIGERSTDGMALGVRAIDFAILALHRDRVATFPLAGTTLAAAMTWADRQFGAPRGIHLRDYDMPASPIASGARFVGHEVELAELARWYDLGLDVTTRGIAGAVRATDVRIWPHHFDMGAIVFLDPDYDTRQIGVGLSPGDGRYAEPYFYVTPYPVAADRPKPPLAHGSWRTDGWAVLTASEIGADPQRAMTYMTSAVAGARTVVGPAKPL